MKNSLALLSLFTLLLTPCPADDFAEKGRAVFKKNHEAVVTVQIVLKSKFSVSGRGGQSNESRQDVTGTVLDPSGLTVVSLSMVDPAQVFQNMLSGGAEDPSRVKMETELSDLKILLEDGAEVPAEVVLRDRDLDLAFIRPKVKLATPMAALDLTKSGKAQILDQVIALNRLGGAAGRAHSASAERICAIVTRPRLFYVPDSTLTTTTLGCPAFTADGKALGIFVMRSMKGKGTGSLGTFNAGSDNLTSIIVPADDVLKVAKQVPTVATEEKKEK